VKQRHAAALVLVGWYLMALSFIGNSSNWKLSLVLPLHGWRRYAIPFELIAQSHRVHR
jgi:hypothetical protein